jgi:hypothetical protein
LFTTGYPLNCDSFFYDADRTTGCPVQTRVTGQDLPMNYPFIFSGGYHNETGVLLKKKSFPDNRKAFHDVVFPLFCL